MRLLLQKVSCLLIACPTLVMGQTKQGNYETLPLKDLSSFEKHTPNWTIAGAVSMHPFTASKPKFQPGAGILVGTQGAALTSKLNVSDLRMQIEFMVSPGASGFLILPGGQKILISDSYRHAQLDASTSGYLNQFPKQNAAKAPGLWQKLEFAYDATVPNLPHSARLNTLNLNDVNILESIYFETQKSLEGPQPLGLEVTKGTIAFRNIGYHLLQDRKPLAINHLKYKVYSDSWDSKTYNTLSHEGQSAVLSQEVTQGMKEFHLVYEGDVQVDEAGEYTFTAIYSGPMFDLEIDGKPVLNTTASSSQEPHRGSIALTKGTHRFKLHYSRFPWIAPALGLMIEKSGIRPYSLHTLSSLPEPEPKPNIRVEAAQNTEMVRSFIQFQDEKYKRTHCISVGTPSGWNYTVDLNRGAFMQAWRGDFANVTEMWYERGEPQLLYPSGLRSDISGKSSMATLPTPQSSWPDSSNIDYKGYSIDEKGFPYFRYQIGGTEIADHLTTDEKQITRTFQFTSPATQPVYALAATGQNIIQIEPGLFQVDDRYYVQINKKSKFNLRKMDGQQELILPISHQTAYQIFW